MLVVLTALLSLVAAAPADVVARDVNPLPGYTGAPSGAVCNHTVELGGVINSCTQKIILLECHAESEPEGGPYVYRCPAVKDGEPYCNTAFLPAEHQFQAACTAPFQYATGCTETYDNGAFIYACPWDGKA